MRSDTLLFFHVLVAMVAVGGLVTAAAAAVAARGRGDERGALLRDVAWRSAIGTVIATLAAVVLGEGLAAQEDAKGAWLDVSRGLAIFGLLLGGAALAALARAARGRPSFTGGVALLASGLVLLGLALAFVMTAKPS